MYIGRWAHIEQSEREQIVYLGLWNAVTTYDKSRGIKFSTHLFNHVRYEYLAYTKKRNKDNRPLFSELDPNGSIEGSETHDGYEQVEVEELLRLVPERTASVLKMRFFDQMTLEEIANVIGCSKQNIQLIINSGLEKMKRHVN